MNEKTEVVEQFLGELARFHAEAAALIDSPAKSLDAELTETAKGGIYDRYATLRQRVLMHFPRVSQGDWSSPRRSGTLYRPDLVGLHANATLIVAGLSAMQGQPAPARPPDPRP